MTDAEAHHPSVSRRSLLLGTAPAAAVGGLLATGAGPVVARGEFTEGMVAKDTFLRRQITLYAEPVGDGYGYGLAPGKASIPGPTLEMYEGEQLEVTLVNSTDRRVSIHVHGVDYDVDSDGTPMNDGCVLPGERRRYVWRAHSMSRRRGGSIKPGSAGYWHYHDHCMGGEHGTEGIAAGLYAALIVRRKGDLLPARRPYVVVMQDMTINGRMAPHTPTFAARLGERVEFVVIGHGNSHHTFHLHGHRWADTRTGNLASPDSEIPVLDTKTVGPADSFGFQVIAGEDVGPGMWMYHCHVQFHADFGMSGIFLVRGGSRGGSHHH